MTTIDDRIRGAVLGTAVADALGAGYEFTEPGPGAPIAMIGGGPFGFDPGEWTDDTAMTAAIVLAAGEHRLDTEAGLDAVAAHFDDWRATGPKDIGGQTRAVLGAGTRTAAQMQAVAEATGPEQAGNGSLMRTAAVAAAFGHDTEPAAALTAADRISRLTHTGGDTHYACRLWTHAIWSAIRTGEMPDLAGLLAADPPTEPGARERWARWISVAEEQAWPDFDHNNGWVVSALQTAWWGITHTAGQAADPAEQYRLAVPEVIRVGHDTDTTAAIAGGLLGAVSGAAALPAQWTAPLHGWPGLDAEGLAAAADAMVR